MATAPSPRMPDSTTSVANTGKATLQHALAVRIPTTAAARAAIGAACQRADARQRRRTRALLRLRGVPIPQLAEAPLARVFINHPAISPQVPITDPHYVGTVSFFGTGAGHAHGSAPGGSATAGPDDPVSFALDLTPTLERLHRLGEPVGSSITVQIVPVMLRTCVAHCEIVPTTIELVTFGG
jgi:hypothetical protein